MNVPRFYCSQLAPGRVVLDTGESRHALCSLRLRPGAQVAVFDGRGRLAHGVLSAAEPCGRTSARQAVVTVEHVLCEPPPNRTLALIVPGCKGPRLSWMVEKLTELGTTRICLTNFARSVVRVGPTHARKLRRTAIEAAKQSRRVWLPDITCAAALPEALDQAGRGSLLIAHPEESGGTLPGRLHTPELADEHVVAVIGPEGGLTPDEVSRLRDGGGRPVRLAPTILRVETAAISLAANWAAYQ